MSAQVVKKITDGMTVNIPTTSSPLPTTCLAFHCSFVHSFAADEHTGANHFVCRLHLE